MSINAKSVCKKVDDISGKLQRMIDKQISQIKCFVTDNYETEILLLNEKIQITDQHSRKLEHMKKRLTGCPANEVW